MLQKKKSGKNPVSSCDAITVLQMLKLTALCAYPTQNLFCSSYFFNIHVMSFLTKEMDPFAIIKGEKMSLNGIGIVAVTL